jgi:3-phenylpropionate/trans-cinnamate dioxygenase ferredoxin reductase subunit
LFHWHSPNATCYGAIDKELSFPHLGRFHQYRFNTKLWLPADEKTYSWHVDENAMTHDQTTPNVIVIGAGQAGGDVVTQLRQNGFSGDVILVGDEPHLPYLRPPLSKAFLAGEVTAESLQTKGAAAYEKAAVTVRTGERVQKIDRHEKRISLENGEVLAYGHLVLATGGRPRVMKVPGAALKNIFYLRTIADVEALRAAFLPGRRVVIVGGGYIGLEVASIAVKKGLDVTILEGAPRVLVRVTSPEMSAFYERIHRREGVKIRTGIAVSGFLADAAGVHVTAVECGDEQTVQADLVIVGIGLIPNTELAETAGLLVDNGIVVNDQAQTSDPHIYAIGDCAAHAHHEFLKRKVRLESVPNATEQARAAAAAICGKKVPPHGAPWFWSDQYDLKLQMVGLSDGYDEVVLRGDPESESFIAIYLKNGGVIAADAVNRIGDFMAAKRLVAEGKAIPREALADESESLKAVAARF